MQVAERGPGPDYFNPWVQGSTPWRPTAGQDQLTDGRHQPVDTQLDTQGLPAGLGAGYGQAAGRHSLREPQAWRSAPGTIRNIQCILPGAFAAAKRWEWLDSRVYHGEIGAFAFPP